SIWSDGYYMTDNTGGANKVWAMERTQMLAGNAGAQILGFDLPGIVTSGFYSPQFLSVSDDNLPAAGGATVVYLQDNAWGGVATDHVKLWTIDVNWGAGSGVVSAASEINTTAFISVFDGGSFSNLAQPSGGTSLDALQATVMNQAQFRKFATHNSAVFNFVVDTDGGAGELAGVRWFEFRQVADNQPWTLYQEGTYTAPNGKHAWNASLIMDGNGNIGMGYSSMSGPSTPTTEFVGSYYTGRFDGDPLGVMTVMEGVIAAGTSNFTSTRYGDYSKICIDPADDATFWFINEYMNSGRKGVVGAFILDTPQPDDIGVISITDPNSGVLSATEDITVDIRNFGSNDITNPDVQYTIDGGAAVVETYTGIITSGSIVSYTFATQADLSAAGSFDICAKTNLTGDTNISNDETCKNVINGIIYCTPPSDCSHSDGITKLVIGTIVNNAIPCITGYDDFTAMSTTLNAGSSYDMVVQTGYNALSEMASMWIDYDDNGVFAAGEQIFADEVVNPDAVDITISFTIAATATPGAHRMRIRAGDTDFYGDLNDPCESMENGTTHDYTFVIAGGTSGIDNITMESAQMQISTLENNQYDISLESDFDGIISIAIYNINGQVVAYNNLKKEGEGYNYHLDMSYSAAGVYLIKMGNLSNGALKMERIVVE
ncbi:MAG: T9SS type A sorting domain-containing protein, partial [Crocinitomicaceae bacterium]|nr:T9SS type A sorting domain-containing protein [Crocinitomicaceae bacterium]